VGDLTVVEHFVVPCVRALYLYYCDACHNTTGAAALHTNTRITARTTLVAPRGLRLPFCRARTPFAYACHVARLPRCTRYRPFLYIRAFATLRVYAARQHALQAVCLAPATSHRAPRVAPASLRWSLSDLVYSFSLVYLLIRYDTHCSRWLFVYSHSLRRPHLFPCAVDCLLTRYITLLLWSPF